MTENDYLQTIERLTVENNSLKVEVRKLEALNEEQGVMLDKWAARCSEERAAKRKAVQLLEEKL